MSAWTDFRDSIVKEVVPEQYRDLTADRAGQLAGQALVKVASSKPAGNLTAAEIEAGARGAASQGLSPAPQQLFGLTLSKPVLVVLGVGVLGVLFVLTGRRRRG